MPEPAPGGSSLEGAPVEGAPVEGASSARVALVTGASRGIGRELVLGLARAGWSVGALARDALALDELVEEVVADGGRAVATAVDITDARAVAAAVRALELELGGSALLVNCAGAIEAVEVPPWEVDPDQVRRVLQVNVLGSFHLVRAVVPGMVARGGGRVVDLSSGAAHRDAPLHAAYAASKAALFRLGGSLTLAGAPRGVLAFEVSPGVVRTAMSTSMAQHAERTEWTDPADVVAMVDAVGRGELDAWAGRFVRVGVDTPASLAEAARAGLPPGARRLDVQPYGPQDPLA